MKILADRYPNLFVDLNSVVTQIFILSQFSSKKLAEFD